MFKNTEMPENLVAGRNPVTELLRSDRATDKILMLKDAGGSLNKIAAMARERGIPIKEVTREKLDFLCPASTTRALPPMPPQRNMPSWRISMPRREMSRCLSSSPTE